MLNYIMNMLDVKRSTGNVAVDASDGTKYYLKQSSGKLWTLGRRQLVLASGLAAVLWTCC